MSTTTVNHILSYLKTSKSNPELCDVIIHCTDVTVYCQSLILAAVSSFWKNLFHIENICSLLSDGNVILGRPEKKNFKQTFQCFFPDININTGRDKSYRTEFQKLCEIGKEMTPRTCEYCFRYFSSKEVCQQHIKTVHKDKNAVCDICNGKFKSKFALDNHIKLKHSENPPQEYSCLVCKTKFGYESSLKRHIKIKGHQHEPDISISGPVEGCEACSICGEEIEDLQEHMDKKHKPKRFPCKKCEKSFHRKDTLHKHEETVHYTFNINFEAAHLLL